MINKNTLFILGAGASKPYGYPSGADLRRMIVQQYEGLLLNLVQIKGSFDEEDLQIILENLKFFLPEFDRADAFIDLFLSRRPEFERLGKIGIILSILAAEMDSKFREDMHGKNYQLNWYSYLFAKLTEDMSEPLSYKKFSENNINFVTFNYDRSLEYYLSIGMAANFNLRANQIRDIFDKMQFEHVYGKIDNLPWQQGNTSLSYQKSGQKINMQQLNSLIKNIYLIQDRKTIDKKRIANLIQKSSRIYFLGFSYLKENMDVIDIINNTDTQKHIIYRTGYGFKESEINAIVDNYFYTFKRDDISNSRIKNKKLNILPIDSLELLKEFPL